MQKPSGLTTPATLLHASGASKSTQLLHFLSPFDVDRYATAVCGNLLAARALVFVAIIVAIPATETIPSRMTARRDIPFDKRFAFSCMLGLHCKANAATYALARPNCRIKIIRPSSRVIAMASDLHDPVYAIVMRRQSALCVPFTIAAIEAWQGLRHHKIADRREDPPETTEREHL